MHTSKYLMNIDLDEYIVPHSKQTIPELLGYLESDDKNIAAFNFQNAFFCLQLPDDTNRKYDLRVLKKTLRTQSYNPPRKRSKYICVTKNIVEVGIHFVWESERGVNLNVSPENGTLYHYRQCGTSKEWGGDKHIVDQWIYLIQDELIGRVKNKWLELSKRNCFLD